MGLVLVRDVVEDGTAHSTVRRYVAAGDWERPYPNLLDVTLQRWNWERRVMAAVMTAPRGTLASHATAAALHDLPGFKRSGSTHLLAPRSGRNRELPFVVHSTTVPATATTVDDIPCTGVPRTLHGLAALGDARGLARGVRAVLRRGSTSAEDVLDPRLQDLPGRALLERTVTIEAGRLAQQVDSTLEEQWVDRLLDWGLPAFTTQHPTTVEGHHYRLDVAWDDRRTALEGDGDGFHGDHRSQDADGHRQERLQRARWSITRVGFEDLRPDRAERIRRRLLAHLEQ